MHYSPLATQRIRPSCSRLLTMNSISAIADVRSRPYSRMNPQFNQEPLKAQLKMAGIAYAPLGRELARTDRRPILLRKWQGAIWSPRANTTVSGRADATS